jgi:transcriptional regulator with XRE-family HTH domain
MLQQDFAQAVGVTPSVVSHYLSGEAKPSSRTALKIVEFTGGEITLGDLFTWEGA